MRRSSARLLTVSVSTSGAATCGAGLTCTGTTGGEFRRSTRVRSSSSVVIERDAQRLWAAVTPSLTYSAANITLGATGGSFRVGGTLNVGANRRRATIPAFNVTAITIAREYGGLNPADTEKRSPGAGPAALVRDSCAAIMVSEISTMLAQAERNQTDGVPCRDQGIVSMPDFQRGFAPFCAALCGFAASPADAVATCSSRRRASSTDLAAS